MQIKQTKKEELKHEYAVTLSGEEVSEKIDEKLQEIGKTVNMPGFRPGKIPLKVLKSKYGKAVMGEVLEKTVDETTLKAINENELRPATRPKIEVKTFDEKDGLEYTMEVELLPEFDVMDFSTIKLEKLFAKPDDKAIEESLKRIASAKTESEKLEEDRGAKKGEIVVIDFDGTVDGKPSPGMKGEGFSLELGSKSFIDTFEEQLEGGKVGDHKTITVTFPKDYGQETLQGVEAVFEVDIKDVRVITETKIDEEFAKAMGFESLDKIKETITEQMQSEYDQVARMNIKRQLLDIIDEKHDFAVPTGMVDAEFYSIWQQINGHQHPDDPNHVHGEKCDHEHEDAGTEEDVAEYRDIASRRVKLGLVLAEVGKVNKIEVQNNELQQAVIAEARKYQGQEAQVFEFYQKNPQALEGLKAPIYEEKVVDFVLDTAKVEEREVSIEELTKASEEANQDSVKTVASKSKTKAKKKPVKKSDDKTDKEKEGKVKAKK